MKGVYAIVTERGLPGQGLHNTEKRVMTLGNSLSASPLQKGPGWMERKANIRRGSKNVFVPSR